MNQRHDCATPTNSPSLTPSCHHTCPHVLTPSHLSLHLHSLTLVPMSPHPHSLTLVPMPSLPHLSPHPHSLTLNCPSTLTPSHLSLHPHSLTSPHLPLSHILTPSLSHTLTSPHPHPLPSHLHPQTPHFHTLTPSPLVPSSRWPLEDALHGSASSADASPWGPQVLIFCPHPHALLLLLP